MKPEFRILPVTKEQVCRQAWPNRVLTTICPKKKAILAIAIAALTFPTAAFAIGLGVPWNGPVLMQPLRIDVPLLVGADETLPRIDCVSIVPVGDGTDLQFFPKQVKLAIETLPTPHIRITSIFAVREPFLEFRLILGCHGPMSRDYLVLTRQNQTVEEQHIARAATKTSSPSTDLVPGVRSTELVDPKGYAANSSAPGSNAVAAQKIVTDASSVQDNPVPKPRLLTLKRDSTLNALARGRYPDNQMTRDEYRRLMAQANPGLFSGTSQVGSVLLPAGTVLTIPSNLPPVERGPTQQVSPGSSAAPDLLRARRANAKTAAENTVLPGGKNDRLVIGGGGGKTSNRPMSAKEAAETIERLDQMLTAQAASENQLTEKLKSLEAEFTSTRSQLQFLEAKSKQQEADQRALQAKLDARPETRPLGFVELMILVLTSGVIGAGLLVFRYRQRTTSGGFYSPGSRGDVAVFDLNSGVPAKTDRNLETLEPHPIFSTEFEAPERDFDEEIVPTSKMVGPKDSAPELPWLSTRSKEMNVSVSPDRRSPKSDEAPADSQRSRDEVAQSVTATSPSGNAEEPIPDSAGSSIITSPVAPISAIPSHPSDIDFPAKAPKRTTDFSETKRVPEVPATMPEIAFSLDLDSLSKPNQRAPFSDLEYPSAHQSLGQLDSSVGTSPELAMPFDLALRTDAEMEAAAALERKAKARTQASVTKTESLTSAEDPAVELAGIMISMGMDDHAERTLIDYILEDPKRDLGPWLKALEIYRESGRRAEFEELAVSLRKNLNVAPDPWESEQPRITQSLEGFSRVSETIQRLWPTEAADAYLGSLLGDNRDGSRAGFPQSVAEDILWLLRILRVRREIA
jgi:hypothetical protein